MDKGTFLAADIKIKFAVVKQINSGVCQVRKPLCADRLFLQDAFGKHGNRIELINLGKHQMTNCGLVLMKTVVRSAASCFSSKQMGQAC